MRNAIRPKPCALVTPWARRTKVVTEEPSHSVPAQRWRPAARLLHGITAALCLGAAGLAFFLVNPPDWSSAYIARYEAGIVYHKFLGLAALAAVLAWCLWRGRRLPLAGSFVMRISALFVHLGLWLLLIIVPLSGYFGTLFYGGEVAIPGLIGLAVPLQRNEALGKILGQVHLVGAYLLLVLFAIHFLAALYHRFILKDDVMQRVL